MPLFKSALDNPGNEVILFDEKPQMEDVVEMHQPDGHQFHFPSLPTAGVIEVSEDSAPKSVKEKGPRDRWDWQSLGLEKFMEWCQDRLNSIPDLSGNETTAIERGISYLERFNKEISKAISTDYDGDIDVKAIETVRKWIFKSIKTLKEIFDQRHESDYNGKEASVDGKMVKEARTPYNGGIIVTVPLIISRCARVCINGAVSAGHDLPSLYHEQVKKYSLDTREQAELAQHLEDMGFPIRADRLMLPDEEVEIDDGRGDLASNYKA
eukprot:gnl/Spiro4/4055_TR2017_c0_g1_i1.p3 gnl/Spiro4/4055_TR2017_c0_g1~~gnl/Spiro4/4055_TR2017_c0_g1_i1.p3  ORF type:complete len:267 (-),score=-16.60 gnl/Spiro4/4055_TR2017_c0_g1_i1:3807-4607(-)